MKTMKRIVAFAVLMVGLTTMANSSKVITTEDDNVTITKVNQLVQVSVLNIEEDMYKLTIYNASGDLVFERYLGDDRSLGKRFDFNKAPKGVYSFVFTTGKGKEVTYSIEAGSNR
ncbi:MAG: hypothetical protein HKN48_05700 [Flavobacteriaceae bacterium]|nr:hypothetical protein [Flavobacteriaceae bacterium]